MTVAGLAILVVGNDSGGKTDFKCLVFQNRIDVIDSNGRCIDGDGYLGGDEGPFSRRVAIQKMPTAGIIQLGDFNNDALADFVLFDPQTLDPTVRVGRNLGLLPGVPGASGAAVGDQ